MYHLLPVRQIKGQSSDKQPRKSLLQEVTWDAHRGHWRDACTVKLGTTPTKSGCANHLAKAALVPDPMQISVSRYAQCRSIFDQRELMSKYLKALTHGTIQEVVCLAEARRIDAEANAAGALIPADLLERVAKGADDKSIALCNLILSLPGDQKDELLALMWLGRAAAGETVEMWSDLLKAAHGHDESGKTSMLAEKSLLDTYLTDGLKRLGE